MSSVGRPRRIVAAAHNCTRPRLPVPLYEKEWPRCAYHSDVNGSNIGANWPSLIRVDKYPNALCVRVTQGTPIGTVRTPRR